MGLRLVSVESPELPSFLHPFYTADAETAPGLPTARGLTWAR
jgi:hypothetical protein